MQLPYSDQLNIQYLGRLFDNTSECYKLFWFKAIMTKINVGKESIFMRQRNFLLRRSVRGFWNICKTVQIKRYFELSVC